jgi:hypothetical protein
MTCRAKSRTSRLVPFSTATSDNCHGPDARAFHATNQTPLRAVDERLICLYCPLDPTDGGSSERYSLSTRYAAATAGGQLNAIAYLIG